MLWHSPKFHTEAAHQQLSSAINYFDFLTAEALCTSKVCSKSYAGNGQEGEWKENSFTIWRFSYDQLEILSITALLSCILVFPWQYSTPLYCTVPQTDLQPLSDAQVGRITQYSPLELQLLQQSSKKSSGVQQMNHLPCLCSPFQITSLLCRNASSSWTQRAHPAGSYLLSGGH